MGAWLNARFITPTPAFYLLVSRFVGGTCRGVVNSASTQWHTVSYIYYEHPFSEQILVNTNHM
jgi:hypothetical protein